MPGRKEIVRSGGQIVLWCNTDWPEGESTAVDWLKNGEAFIFDHGTGDLEDLLQTRVAGELSPLGVELCDRIEFPELEVFLGITDDRSPYAPESKSMFSDQWKCALAKCAVIFRDMMSSEAVRDL